MAVNREGEVSAELREWSGGKKVNDGTRMLLVAE